MVLAVFLMFLFQAEGTQQTASNIATLGKDSIMFDWVGNFQDSLTTLRHSAHAASNVSAHSGSELSFVAQA